MNLNSIAHSIKDIEANLNGKVTPQVILECARRLRLEDE